MNPLELFDGKKPFKRIYLQPFTSRRFIPKGMDNLDKCLKKEEEKQKIKTVAKKFMCLWRENSFFRYR